MQELLKENQIQEAIQTGRIFFSSRNELARFIQNFNGEINFKGAISSKRNDLFSLFNPSFILDLPALCTANGWKKEELSEKIGLELSDIFDQRMLEDRDIELLNGRYIEHLTQEGVLTHQEIEACYTNQNDEFIYFSHPSTFEMLFDYHFIDDQIIDILGDEHFKEDLYTSIKLVLPITHGAGHNGGGNHWTSLIVELSNLNPEKIETLKELKSLEASIADLKAIEDLEEKEELTQEEHIELETRKQNLVDREHGGFTRAELQELSNEIRNSQPLQEICQSVNIKHIDSLNRPSMGPSIKIKRISDRKLLEAARLFTSGEVTTDDLDVAQQRGGYECGHCVVLNGLREVLNQEHTAYDPAELAANHAQGIARIDLVLNHQNFMIKDEIEEVEEEFEYSNENAMEASQKPETNHQGIEKFKEQIQDLTNEALIELKESLNQQTFEVSSALIEDLDNFNKQCLLAIEEELNSRLENRREEENSDLPEVSSSRKEEEENENSNIREFFTKESKELNIKDYYNNFIQEQNNITQGKEVKKACKGLVQLIDRLPEVATTTKAKKILANLFEKYFSRFAKEEDQSFHTVLLNTILEVANTIENNAERATYLNSILQENGFAFNLVKNSLERTGLGFFESRSCKVPKLDEWQNLRSTFNEASSAAAETETKTEKFDTIEFTMI
jgi:hypothetical protein